MSRAASSHSPVRRAWLRFLLLVLAALALQGLGALFSQMESDGGAALYWLHLFLILPVCSLLLPFWAGKGGVHPLAGCLPIGGALFLIPVYRSPGMALGCIGLSLVGCVAGQEWAKRKHQGKERHHGGQKNGKKHRR